MRRKRIRYRCKVEQVEIYTVSYPFSISCAPSVSLFPFFCMKNESNCASLSKRLYDVESLVSILDEARLQEIGKRAHEVNLELENLLQSRKSMIEMSTGLISMDDSKVYLNLSNHFHFFFCACLCFRYRNCSLGHFFENETLEQIF